MDDWPNVELANLRDSLEGLLKTLEAPAQPKAPTQPKAPAQPKASRKGRKLQSSEVKSLSEAMQDVQENMEDMVKHPYNRKPWRSTWDGTKPEATGQTRRLYNALMAILEHMDSHDDVPQALMDKTEKELKGFVRMQDPDHPFVSNGELMSYC